MSNPIPDGPGDRIKVSEEPFIIDALRALEVFIALISTDEGRRAYVDAGNKEAVFNEQRDKSSQKSLRRATYDDIPEGSRRALEALSPEQLQALSEIDTQFVADGLYVHVPSPGLMMIH
jgi:hypothetical protein